MATPQRRPAYGDPKKSPYKQSRSALREQFGPRSIDASSEPIEGPSIATDPRTNLTISEKWDDFFNPVESLSSRGQSFLSRFGKRGQSAGATVAGGTAPAPALTTPWSKAPEGSFAPTGYEGARKPVPVDSPLTAAPIDYLKTAMDKSTSFWNQLGVKIPAPIAGQVQAGTSFESKYGTGRVDSGSLLARQKAASQWSGFGAADLKKLKPPVAVNPVDGGGGGIVARMKKKAPQWSGFSGDDLRRL